MNSSIAFQQQQQKITVCNTNTTTWYAPSNFHANTVCDRWVKLQYKQTFELYIYIYNYMMTRLLLTLH